MKKITSFDQLPFLFLLSSPVIILRFATFRLDRNDTCCKSWRITWRGWRRRLCFARNKLHRCLQLSQRGWAQSLALTYRIVKKVGGRNWWRRRFYESVTIVLHGVQTGSRVWIIYDNHRAHTPPPRHNLLRQPSAMLQCHYIGLRARNRYFVIVKPPTVYPQQRGFIGFAPAKLLHKVTITKHVAFIKNLANILTA